MKKKIVIIVVLLTTLVVIGFVLYRQLWKVGIVDNALVSQECEFAERQFEDDSYAGPLIDTHIHMAPLPDGPVPPNAYNRDQQPANGINTTIADYVCMMDTEGTRKVFAFFAVWEPIVSESIELVTRTLKEYPDRFVPFIMPPDHDNEPDGSPTVDAHALQDMLGESNELFVGYGEIGLYEREGGAAALPPDSERLTNIYPVVRQHNLIVYVHLGVGHKESFSRALEANPDINFIFHGDQLVGYGENGDQDLSDIEDLLQKHPNLRYGVDELYGDTFLLRPEVSKEEFLAHFEDRETLLQKDVETWKGFIERHPDQVLWGTDRGWSAPWALDQDVALTLTDYSRAFIGLLDPEVQELFAYKNAEALLQDRDLVK